MLTSQQRLAHLSINSGLTANNYNLNLTADEINLTTPNSVIGTGQIALQPFTAGKNIILNGSSDSDPVNSTTNTLDITQTDLAALAQGFNSVTIGNSSGSGAVTVNNPVTFKDSVTIQSPKNGMINVNGAITGNASVTLNGKTTNLNADITANDKLTFNQLVSLGADVTVKATNGDISFNSTVDGGKDLNAIAGNNINLAGAVGQTTRLNNLITSANNINVGSNISTTSDLNFKSPVSFTGSGAKIFNSTGNISFSQTVDGGSDLTLTAGAGKEVTLGGAVGGTTSLSSLTSNATKTNVANNITTTGDIQFNSPLTLTGAGQQTFNSTSGNISFGNKVDGTVVGISDLTVSSGAGKEVTFGGAVGGTTTLSSLTSNATNTKVASNITTTGDIQFKSPVTLTGGGTKVFNSTLGNISFDNTVDGASNLTLTTNGNVALKGALGGTTALSSFTSNATNTNVANNITTTGNITLNSPATLTGDITFNSATGNITLNKLVTLAVNPTTMTGEDTFIAQKGAIAVNAGITAGQNDLNLTADEINLTADENNSSIPPNSITGSGNITLSPFTPSKNIIVNGLSDSDLPNNKPITNTLDLTVTDLAALNPGFSSITIGNDDGSGTIDINTVTFNDPVTIRSPNGTINVKGAIIGNSAVSLEANLVNTSSTTLGADITTKDQPITFLNDVSLVTGAIIKLDAGTSNIQFKKTVDGGGDLSLFGNQI